jgi:hypothetical protein
MRSLLLGRELKMSDDAAKAAQQSATTHRVADFVLDIRNLRMI